VRKWDIYLAYVKFEDIEGGKHRPVLVLEDGAVFPVECLKMTSHEPRSGEYALIKWEDAGLRKPTTVRIGKALQLEEGDFIKQIGRLSAIDISNLDALLNK